MATRKPQPSELRKLEPTAAFPSGAVLRKLSAADAQWLRRRLLDPIECVYVPDFDAKGAEATFLTNVSELGKPRYTEVPDYSQRTEKAHRNLTLAEEAELFRRFNYFRHRTMLVLQEFTDRRLNLSATREVLRWGRMAEAFRDQIAEANLGLVPTMVERSRITGVDFGDLISEGHLALLRSIDKFDCGRGFKFSTYACRAILTAITRSVALMARYRSRFPTDYDPDLQKGEFVELKRVELEDDRLEELCHLLKDNEADLTRTERKVLNERFGLRIGTRQNEAAPKTLRQVAESFGVTKERVRQIQNKALRKLRGELDKKVVPG